MQTKILLIKLGYSETLDPEIGKVASLGDVLRTTPILWAIKEKFPDSHVTWLVTADAEPLLEGNKLIDRILVWDEFIPFQLMREKFDVVINLEKIAGVCALADMIDAWVKYGFRFETLNGTYHGYEQGINFIDYIENKQTDKLKSYWEQILIEMLGVTWKEQRCIIGYKPKTEETLDIGFNYEVGSKWPFKALKMEIWKELEQRFISRGYSVSWQKGNKNLYEYMDWIQSCRLIISNDSLGLHLASTFGKKVVGMFGPTDPSEVFLDSNSRKILPDIFCTLMPCGSPKCHSGLYCMQHINADKIEKAVLEIIPSVQEQ
ncbi:MAG: glycosyltransferase family 9 protein [Desulfuromonadaceae bacterium]|nr:glycosyltransferase family 9 protein [Desulfuromonadaceae bacterium]